MKPGDYPLRSSQSRAAARRVVKDRQAGKRWITLIDDLSDDVEEPRFTPWIEGADGNFGRVAAIPKGMSVE